MDPTAEQSSQIQTDANGKRKRLGTNETTNKSDFTSERQGEAPGNVDHILKADSVNAVMINMLAVLEQ